LIRLVEWRDGFVVWVVVVAVLIGAILLSVLGAATWQERAGWVLVGAAVVSILVFAKSNGLDLFPKWLLVPLLGNQAWIIFANLRPSTFGWAVVLDGVMLSCGALAMRVRSGSSASQS
jgi:hypothetical protein